MLSMTGFRPLCVAALILSISTVAAPAAEPAGVDARLYEQTVSKAVQYLQTKGQAEDGSYSKQAGPAVTALVTTAILRNGRSVDDPLVARSLMYLEGFVQPDGAICNPDSNYKNYETCLAIMCFTEANKNGRYNRLLKGADKFLKNEQWDEGEGHDESSFSYGGAGYGSKKRPDLSNTSFLIEALKATGNGPEDEAIQKALLFVSRCQNLETEHNTTPFSAKNPDGGFYYTIAAGGSSMAGTTEGGGLRSYGSMTYAGLKSMIYAGVGPDDPRVKAALEWIQKNYSVKANPGMEDAGLYYYYNTFAKTLDAVGRDVIEDADGQKHHWRAELVSELARRQRPDGSFANDNLRWMEGDPNLVTGYALLSLSYCRPKKQ
jgi:squalene-hopene/tetraprenyl-beta-curcumene cyclase